MRKHGERKDLPVVARYMATSEWWVDVPEANPRSRVKLRKQDGPEQPVQVYTDGSIYLDDELVEVDTYDGPEFDEAFRNEGRA